MEKGKLARDYQSLFKPTIVKGVKRKRKNAKIGNQEAFTGDISNYKQFTLKGQKFIEKLLEIETTTNIIDEIININKLNKDIIVNIHHAVRAGNIEIA